MIKILTKKAVTASEEELSTNPRSKPALLRGAERLPDIAYNANTTVIDGNGSVIKKRIKKNKYKSMSKTRDF